MLLIADSGSTKTDWRMIDASGKIKQAVTKGINPYYQKKEEISAIITQQLGKDIVVKEIHEVHFYGAGCSTLENKKKVSDVLKSKFTEATIFVEGDMLAAARSLCGHEAGIVCIIGTGSNACFYNGKTITNSIPSLGYVMGDEGSGNYLGKQLIKDYFGKRLSKENVKRFEEFGKSGVHDILDHVYRKHQPSAFLASYSLLIQQYISDPYFYQLVYNSMKHFIHVNVKFFNDYQQTPIHFTGSVAYIYANILRQVAVDEKIFVDKIIQSPIAGLTLFHQNS